MAIPRWEVAIDRTLYGFTISVVVISNETATTLSIGNLYHTGMMLCETCIDSNFSGKW